MRHPLLLALMTLGLATFAATGLETRTAAAQGPLPALDPDHGGTCTVGVGVGGTCGFWCHNNNRLTVSGTGLLVSVSASCGGVTASCNGIVTCTGTSGTSVRCSDHCTDGQCAASALPMLQAQCTG